MNCDRDIEIEVKESMRLPWMKKPFYQTRAKDTTPEWRPKRKGSLANRLRRSWYDFCDDWGDVALCVMIAAIGFAAILCYATWPR